MGTPGTAHLLTLTEAAALLRLPVPSVEALVAAGYLAPARDDGGGGAGDVAASSGTVRFRLGDLKAFLARNGEGAGVEAGAILGEPAADASSFGEIDPRSLLEALSEHLDVMAQRALDVVQGLWPEAAEWGAERQREFLDDAGARFEALLAVATVGDAVDEALVADMASIGADIAGSGSALPEILVVLRVSRDIVVQTAVEVAEQRGRWWGLALSVVLTRVVPAVDRLIDAVARGYWQAVLCEQEDNRARFANVVEHSSDGVCELGADGQVRYANGALAVILGRRQADLVGADLASLVDPSGGLRLDRPRSEVVVRRADGVIRILDVRVLERREGGDVAGYDAVVRDLSAPLRLEALRNDTLALIGHELRQPLTAILGLGALLEGDRPVEGITVAQAGTTIRRQADRIARLADDLSEVSRLEYGALDVDRSRVDLTLAVEAALSSVPDIGADAVAVHVEEGSEVVGDRRRVEQVIANLVENAVVHGAAPVAVYADRLGDEVAVTVRDRGPGVDAAREVTLFDELCPLTGPPRRRSEAGLGLAIVRGLVEAMGGRVWYEPADGGGAAFTFTLPAP